MTDELDSILGQYSVCPKSSEWEERMEERESNWSDSRPRIFEEVLSTYSLPENSVSSYRLSIFSNFVYLNKLLYINN